MLKTKSDYSKYQSWQQKYPDNKVKLDKMMIDESWKAIFEKLFEDQKMKIIEDKLSETLKTSNEYLYPKPDCLFRAFLLTSFTDLKVVIIGQDPYFNHEIIKDKETNNDIIVPQAYGLSFSVLDDFKIPSSLDNIYKNLLKNGHIKKLPKTGRLDFWATQGCLMLNTSLTVVDDQKKIHTPIWKWFTTELIKYISKNKDYVVFVLWGGDAYTLAPYIDLDKHDIVCSSHPSGLSANNKFRNYPSFNEFDHFGKINEFLESHGKDEIYW